MSGARWRLERRCERYITDSLTFALVGPPAALSVLLVLVVGRLTSTSPPSPQTRALAEIAVTEPVMLLALGAGFYIVSHIPALLTGQIMALLMRRTRRVTFLCTLAAPLGAATAGLVPQLVELPVDPLLTAWLQCVSIFGGAIGAVFGTVVACRRE